MFQASKIRTANARKQPVKAAVSAAASVQPETWKPLIADLKDRHFLSTEDAIFALVDGVLRCAKWRPDAEATEETRRAVHELLATDPAVVEILQRTLRIGKC